MPRNRLDRHFERRLSGIVNAREAGVLKGGLKGVEREALRVTPEGRISQAPHPHALGSTLTHPHITTDYSEALIELVTPPFPSAWELQQFLCDIHQFVYSELGDELLWATSMPCVIVGRQRDPHRPVRQLEHRPHEARLPRRPRAPLRKGDAGNLGRSLQLFLPGPALAGARGSKRVEAPRPGLRRRRLFRPAAELPPLWLADPFPVWRLARGLPLVFCRPRRPGGTRAAGEGHAHRATRDLASHERPRLSQQEPGRRLRLGQFARGVRARPFAAHLDPAPGVPGARRRGKRRMAAAEREPAADRERVLQLHPAEARCLLRRAADEGAAARRRAVRRDALARRRRLRPGGRQPAQALLSRSLCGAVPDAREPAALARTLGPIRG